MMNKNNAISLSFQHPILFFDGTCHLCDNAVQFVLKRDTKKVFRFSPLQSNLAKNTLTDEVVHPLPDSLVLLSNGKFYFFSDAALHILLFLSWYYVILGRLLLIFPRWIRNYVYKFIAKNRYKWFGKYDVCIMPAPGWKAQFLDD